MSKPGSKKKKLFYVNGMKWDSLGVATLKREGTNYSEASDKAEILNIQFFKPSPGNTAAKCSPWRNHCHFLDLESGIGRSAAQPKAVNDNLDVLDPK